jgi:hypothetical protein
MGEVRRYGFPERITGINYQRYDDKQNRYDKEDSNTWQLLTRCHNKNKPCYCVTILGNVNIATWPEIRVSQDTPSRTLWSEIITTRAVATANFFTNLVAFFLYLNELTFSYLSGVSRPLSC